MKPVERLEWLQLKNHSRQNLTDPLWMGGVFCVNRHVVEDRPALVRGPWEALIARDARTTTLH
ncbi:MAG: hypothetical protein ABJA94_03435 [Rhodoglobus sp.]